MGVLFSAAVVLGESSIYLPIVLKDVGCSSAGVPRTGQTISYGTRDDGALQKGVAWPNPRFTRNISGLLFNGTVTDNLTGLIWLKDANCFGTRTWVQALSDANTLASPGCGLHDGSTAGQWRLPNIKELQSLIDFAYRDPALSNGEGTGHWEENDRFTGVQPGYYWSSTSYVGGSHAWEMNLPNGGLGYGDKTLSQYVWLVRDGQ
jgi:hypothetical protein